MITFACPACRRSITVPPSAAGAHGRCPGCGAAVTAPAVDAATVLGTRAGAPQPGPASPSDAGRRLGRYVLEAELGRGGMGVVYRAQDTQLRRAVALKTLLAGDDGDPEALQRFRREAQAGARLRHPGIVTVYEVGEADGTHYMVMDLVDGASLAKRLGEGKLPLEDAVRVVRDVARAVQHAHEQGVVHRDLKPQNVMLDREGRALVMDFGLAKLQGATQLTRDGSMMGTPAYMPPEQVDGDQVDARSDVYSLGATLYHAITGQPPFAADNRHALIAAVITKDPAPPSARNRRAQGDLDTICLRALEKEPSRRYATAADLAADLDRWLEGEPIAARPVGAWGRLARTARRNKAVSAAVLAAVAATACGAAVATWQWVELRRSQALAERREREAQAQETARALAEAERQQKHAADLQAALDSAGRSMARMVYERAVLALHERRDGEAAVLAAAALEQAHGQKGSAWELASYRAALVAARGGCWTSARAIVQMPRPEECELVVSADGRRFAVLGRSGHGALWSAETNETARLVAPPSGWRTGATLDDAGRLFVRGPRGMLHRFDARGVLEGTLTVETTEGIPAVSPDGRLLALPSRLGAVIVDLASGQANVLVPPDRPPYAARVLWGPVEGGLMTIGGGKVAVFDLPTRRLMALWGDNDTSALAVSQDRTVFVTGTEGGLVRTWVRPADVSLELEPVERHTVKGHSVGVRTIAFSPRGNLFATRAVDGWVRVWTRRGALASSLQAGSPPNEVGFLHDGRLLVPMTGGLVGAFDTTSIDVDGHDDGVRSLDFSADGTLASLGLDGEVRTWEAGTAPPTRPLRVVGLERNAFADTVVSTSTGVVVGRGDGAIERVDVEGRVSRIGAHPSRVQAATEAGPGRILSAGGDVRLWELDAPTRPRWTWSDRARGTAMCVASDPRRGRAAVGTTEGSVIVLDLESGAVRTTLESGKTLYCVAFSTDGERVVAGTAQGTLVDWDVDGGEPREVVVDSSTVIAALDVSPDGALLASASLDGIVRLWRTDTLEPAAELQRHVGKVMDVAFSPDGRWLASAGDDGHLCWWPLREIFGGPDPGELRREVEAKTGFTVRDGSAVRKDRG